MVSDKPNIRNSLTLLIFALIVLIVTVSAVMMYLSARQASLAKTQPYAVELVVQSNAAGKITAEYDYGYGFNKGHEQNFLLQANDLPQTVSFTISAWKTLNSLRLSSNNGAALGINSVTLTKNGLLYQPRLSESIDLGRPYLLENVHTKLLEGEK